MRKQQFTTRRSDPKSEPKRLLTFEQLRAAAEEVLQASRAERISVAAAGGYAMQIYGSDRLTVDLDVVAAEMPASMQKLSRLSFGGYASCAADAVPVDVIVREDKYKKLYCEALKVAATVRGIPLRVVTRPHLAVMKMVAGRAKDDLDLDFLLITMPSAERIRTQAIIERHLGVYAVDEFDNRILEAEWKVSRGRI